jgi:4-hydroxy-2-oxoheptanedioate aldolase
MFNKLKTKIDEGSPVINAFVTMATSFGAETIARAGWDSVTFDMQHGIIDYHDVVHGIQAMQNQPVTPLVRVPWNEPGIIGKVLDAGALGVICPMVNTRDDAVRLTSAMRYPPQGTRSYGPARAETYGEAGGYFPAANASVLCIPMIETVEAIANLDEILGVPGVDGVYVGPSDLGLSMGLPPALDRTEPELLDALKFIATRAKTSGKFAGLHNATGAYAARMWDIGFQFSSVLTDSGLLLRAAKAEVAAFRNGLKLAS